MLESKMFLETSSASITSIPSSIKNLAAEDLKKEVTKTHQKLLGININE